MTNYCSMGSTDTSTSIAFHNFMVSQIDDKLSLPKMKSLQQLALDTMCGNVSDRVDSDSMVNDVHGQNSIINTLPLPRKMIEQIIVRLDNITTQYFDLFIEPYILYSQDECMSLAFAYSSK